MSLLFLNEKEARARAAQLISENKWPCHFFASDTTGEKESEEFFTAEEVVVSDRFKDIDVILAPELDSGIDLREIISDLDELQSKQSYSKTHIVNIFSRHLPSFSHSETEKSLDQRM